MKIVVIDAATAGRHIDRFSDILRGSVLGGALVGFVLPFEPEQADDYWKGVLKSVATGERVLLAAWINGQIAGTVQLYLSPEPNAPHRAEIFKLLVHGDFQRQGVGTALMLAAETEAARRHRSLLLLDTVSGGPAEKLYRRSGWQEIGIVPCHFVDPYGNPKSSIYFMKCLDERCSSSVSL